ncbi:MAG: nuclear transport factor 2 family protein [Jatrophihabitans sp.]|uniref:nuclear transport factor 2 family protein n=1 Tax=Jatrophihabitans sp. TaxID=1932789 RepID=UPI003F7DCE97
MDVYGRFRAAVEANDHDAIMSCFTDDIRLFSPVKFTPFAGKAEVGALFAVLLRTFEDFRYVGELTGEVEHGAGGEPTGTHVLVFRCQVAGKQVHGIDLMQADASGLIDSFTVMLRPMSAAQAVGQAVLAGLVADGAAPG